MVISLAQFEVDACISFDANRDAFLNVKWNVSIERFLQFNNQLISKSNENEWSPTLAE